MKKTVIALGLFMCAGLAQADLYQSKQADGTFRFSDKLTASHNTQRLDRQISNPLEAADLPGIWKASSINGNKTELTLRSNGSFVFDQANDATPHRVYMCGTWAGAEDALALVVKALKRQLESGEIEQADGAHQEQAKILSARKDRIILMILGEKLVFDRAG